MSGSSYHVVFVCLGNICRSPTAEVVMRSLVHDAGLDGVVSVESAGTGDWHVGEGADSRALETLTAGGYDGTRHRARQFDVSWFDRADVVVAMDASNLDELRRLAPPGARERIRLLREWDPDAALGDLDVPDPYLTDGHGDRFASVLAMVERSCRALLADIRADLHS